MSNSIAFPPKPRISLSRRAFVSTGVRGLIAMMGPSLLVHCSSEESSSGRAPANRPGGAGRPGVGEGLTSNLGNVADLGTPDANGVRVPAGFTARIVAMTAERPVSSSDYEWHVAPDGGATFATPDGGWIYVSNSEFPIAGGVGALRFDADGTLVDAYPLLRETNVNCAGGATPWGTWLSCEEVAEGRVFECDPLGEHDAIEHAALGLFKHEAVAVDATQNHLYLTEDESNGGFYRFVPDRIASDGYADLSAGKLQIAELATDGAVTWHDVPDRLLTEGIPTREQVAASTPFKGGEGIWYFDDTIFFSTKGDNRVWAYSVTQQRLDVLYDAAAAQDPVLTGVDNLTGTCCGDILVAEDGGDMQIVAIRPDGSLKVLAQVVGHDESEITGPAFDPSGTRLYFSSQRGVGSGGITYEVTGPFHLKA